MKRVNIEIKESSIHKYGVFALSPIKPGNIIEECPILLVSDDDIALEHYWFSWRNTPIEQTAIALGYGSLYNHSQDPNAVAEQDYRRKIIAIVALKPILPGEEIFISYGKNWLTEHGIKEVKPRSVLKDNIFFLCKAMTVIGVIVLLKLGLKH